MRYRIAILALVVLGGAGLWFFMGQNNASQTPQLLLTSQPFPLVVGSSTLLVGLTDSTGASLEGAKIYVTGTLNHPGMLPSEGRGMPMQSNGLYPVRMVWSSTGDWRIDVTAVLPNEDILKESFEVFVFPVPPENTGPLTHYKSLSENAALVGANPEREKWLVIPMGTQAVLRQGHGEDSEDILLKIGGQDTLVIRNDDIADHTVGPFFIRSGETVRQRFTEPAVFKGECSVSDNGSISIIVEG